LRKKTYFEQVVAQLVIEGFLTLTNNSRQDEGISKEGRRSTVGAIFYDACTTARD
jgi:hypothetical protein